VITSPVPCTVEHDLCQQTDVDVLSSTSHDQTVVTVAGTNIGPARAGPRKPDLMARFVRAR